MGDLSWVTLATNDSYSLGALVLAHSLKRVGTQHQLVVMVTPGVTAPMREKLSAVFNLVFEVNILDSKDERNLMLLQRPELGITFTKLHCWRLTQFKKCVFLDADTMVLQNCDELFERDEFSAAPDVGWPDCFNSGVFVYVPSDQTFNSLLTFALEKGSFDGGDQGLLNLYFSDWAHKDITKHLPFIYNMCSTASYSYLPAFKQYAENVKIVHFIGNSKPWLQYFNSETLQVQCTPGFNHLQAIFDHWWNLFCSHVHSNLASTMAWTMRIASSCTSTSHVLSNLTESKYEDSLYVEQFSSDITIPIWDPWETYLPTNIDTNPQNEPISFPQINVVKIVASQPATTNNNPPGRPKYQEQNLTNFTITNPVHSSEKPVTNINSIFPLIKNDYVDHNVLPTPLPLRTDYHQPHPLNACLSADNCALENQSELQSVKTISQSDNTDLETDLKGGLAGAFAQMTLREPKSDSQGALEEHIRRQGWEAGRIDYLGQDSFDNVWKKICETMSGVKKEPTPPKEVPVTLVPEPAAVVTPTPVPETPAAPVPVAEILAPAPAPVPAAVPVAPAVPEVAAAPASETATPAPEVAAAPVAETSTPTPEVAAVPAPEVAAVPVPEVATTPTPEVATTSAPEVAATPAPEVAATPAPEVAATPAPEVAATPAPEVAATPAPEVAATPAPVATPAPTPAPEPTPSAIPAPEATPAPAPAVAPIPVFEATPVAAPETKPIEEKKSEEQKPSEPAKVEAVVATPEIAKPAPEAATQPQATPPAITETPATPQTPDASKQELKPLEAAASSQPALTPVPPPRKGSKGGNGGATTKKSSKKKQ